jgi:uncharacterized membrane protein YdjX (TVP38/TMEM64 family)
MQPRRLAILLVLVALLVATVALDPVHEAVARGLEWAKQIIERHERLGVVLFMLLSAISAILFFFSTAVLVPVAVYTWGKPTTMFLLWAAWLFGAVVSYLIGSRPGRRLAGWLVPERRIARYEKAISARANFPLVLLFQVAVPSEVPGYVLGAVHYHFGRYLGARALAEVPFAVGAVYLGDSFVRRQYGPLLAIAIGGILVSALALYLLHRRMADKDSATAKHH